MADGVGGLPVDQLGADGRRGRLGTAGQDPRLAQQTGKAPRGSFGSDQGYINRFGPWRVREGSGRGGAFDGTDYRLPRDTGRMSGVSGMCLL